MPTNNFRTPEGDIENESFITEYWLIDQFIGDELWGWGANNSGRLGTNNTISTSVPVTTFAGGTNWKQVSNNADSSAAIKTDGSLWVWGNGATSSLGTNNTVSRSTPVTTFAGGTNWKQISISDHAAAIKNDGSLWTWGYNANGKTGTGEVGFTETSTPVTTFAGGNDWKQVSVGSQHTAAIKTDRSLWIWGQNVYQQLGVGESSNLKSIPVTTFAGGYDWKQVSCGLVNTAAIKTDGTLWVWGRNTTGQLGINSTDDKSTPVTTFAGGNDWKQVSCGSPSTIGSGFIAAIKTDGSLWVWGRNVEGQLGNNDIVNSLTPITTFAGGTNWKQVSCGNNHVSAIKTDGSLWGWGTNTFGQLGTNDSNIKLTPVTTFTGGNNWKMVSSGLSYTVAVTSGPDY